MTTAAKADPRKRLSRRATPEVLQEAMDRLKAGGSKNIDYRLVNRIVHLMLSLDKANTKREALTTLSRENPELKISPATFWRKVDHRMKTRYSERKKKDAEEKTPEEKPAKEESAIQVQPASEVVVVADTAGHEGESMTITPPDAITVANTAAPAVVAIVEPEPQEEKPPADDNKHPTRRGALEFKISALKARLVLYEDHIRRLAQAKNFKINPENPDGLVFIDEKEFTTHPEPAKDKQELLQDNINLQRMVTHMESKVSALELQVASKDKLLEKMAQEHSDESQTLRERSEKEIDLIRNEVNATAQATLIEEKGKLESEISLLKQEIERLSAVDKAREEDATKLAFQRIEVDKPILLVKTKMYLEKDPRPVKLIYLMPNGKVEGVEAEYPALEEEEEAIE